MTHGVRFFVLAVVLALTTPSASFGQAFQFKDSSGKIDLAGGMLWSACGDNVAISKGFLEYKFHLVSNGENFHIQSHFHAAGQGVGVILNEPVVFSNTSSYSFSGHQSGFVYSATGKFRFNRRGRGGDMVIKFNYHITVNANGEVTANFYNFRIECE